MSICWLYRNLGLGYTGKEKDPGMATHHMSSATAVNTEHRMSEQNNAILELFCQNTFFGPQFLNHVFSERPSFGVSFDAQGLYRCLLIQQCWLSLTCARETPYLLDVIWRHAGGSYHALPSRLPKVWEGLRHLSRRRFKRMGVQTWWNRLAKSTVFNWAQQPSGRSYISNIYLLSTFWVEVLAVWSGQILRSV